jgi:chloride channel protein, CIC family
MAKQIRDRKRRINLSLNSLWHIFRHPTLQEHIDVNYLTKWLLLGAIIGVGAGLSAIVFHRAIEFVTQWTLGKAAGFYPPQPLGEGQAVISTISHLWVIPVITTLGGLLAGIVVYKLAPEAEGHGTDTAIDSFHNKNGLIRWRIPYVKFLASTITIGTGGSAGPEGPASQMGAGFGSFVAQILHLSVEDRRIAVAAGMGAGIAAIFKAPLGGAILAAEILYLQGMESEVLIPAFISSMIAYVIYAGVQGFTPIFGTGLYIAFNDGMSLLYYAILGIACGLIGILCTRTFTFVKDIFHKMHIPRILKPALGGLLTGIIALWLPQVLGVGYGWTQLAMTPDAINIGLVLLAVLVLAKIVATAFTVESGGSGGVFAPGIVIGGLLGAVLWGVMRNVPHMPSLASFVIVGMMAFLGSVGHVPLAVMVMIAEITGSYQLLAPAMIAVGLAYVIIGKNTMYKSQVLSPAESPAHRDKYAYPLLNRMLVKEAMKWPVTTLSPEATITEAANLMQARGIKGVPIINTRGNLAGIIANIDVVKIRHNKWQSTRIQEVMSTDLAIIHAEDRLDYALNLMRQRNIGRLPVVEENNPHKLIGIITSSDIVGKYMETQSSMLSTDETSNSAK